MIISAFYGKCTQAQKKKTFLRVFLHESERASLLFRQYLNQVAAVLYSCIQERLHFVQNKSMYRSAAKGNIFNFEVLEGKNTNQRI